MAATDRLSGLPDDLLASVISFLPTREAARTAALSRRRRPLWLRTDAINLDTSYYRRTIRDYHVKDRLLRDARAALGATGRCTVRKLSMLVAGPSADDLKDDYYYYTPKRSSDTYDLTASLLATPALRQIEELHAGIVVPMPVPQQNKQEEDAHRVYELDPAKLPGHTLRVLDLARCHLESSPGTTAFPRLATLRLCKCSSTTTDLEDIIRAAPTLGSLHIESHTYFGRSKDDTRCQNFVPHCPSLTTLTLTLPDDGETTIKRIELDAPRLRALRYDGLLVEFSMKSPASELEQADLTLGRTTYGVSDWSATYGSLLRCLRQAKVLRLKVPEIMGIAGVQVTLHRLERLDFEVPYKSCNACPIDDAAGAMADLFQCFPVIHDLRIRILPHPPAANVPLQDFDVSMYLFEKRDSEEMAPLMFDDGFGSTLVLPELPSLTGSLGSHLKNVRLEFELTQQSIFEVCLAKFFAENCMDLEVLEVDDGKQWFFAHIGWTVERWRAKALEQSKQMERNSNVEAMQTGKREMDGDVQHNLKNKS
ncbi:hypothetical protein CFC21_027711 [Triticum aestivum]|uniref:F-box domain-containing protein n=2 Tax=Triticum aestivum TaxID=4565 RepID=A0A9R1JE81_WHEAT|nr:hypothetical protein CFC21_027711 [Triticum aestivum]